MNYLKIAGGGAFLAISVLAGCASSHGRGCAACSSGCGTCQPSGPSYVGDPAQGGSGSTGQYQPAPAGSSSGPAYAPPAYSAPPAGSGSTGSGGR